MILLSKDGDAISFNDDGSPNSRKTGGTKVCINGQVNRALSVDWFYQLLALFPDIPGELKSARVVAGFNNLPSEKCNSIWRSLRRVQIHIVDARPYYREIEELFRRVSGRDETLEGLRQMAADGDVTAQFRLALARQFVAESILHHSTAVRLQSLGRAFSDPFGEMETPEALSPFFGDSRLDSAPLIDVEDFGRPEDRNIVRRVASWSSKSAAAFHQAFDAVTNPDDDDAVFNRFDFGRAARGQIVRNLTPPHAFDVGNRPHIQLLERTRSSMFDEFAANDWFYQTIGRRNPGFIELESKESHYIQAADFAAGIASDIYASRKVIGVVERFEYVTFNGQRVSLADAEEQVRADNG